MTKYSGKIGYAITTETSPGKFIEQIVERKYRGDITRNTLRIDNKVEGVNKDRIITSNISIVADPYAYNNIDNIRYITYRGNRWEVSTADISRPPRIDITLGGVYNGLEAENG